MGIYLKDLKEGCCEYPENLKIIDGDSLDANSPTCDKIIECKDRYILIEEKSFLLGFFNSCCKEKGKNLGSYIKDEKLDKSFFDYLDTLSKDEKKRLFAESIIKLFVSSLNKVSNTTYILTANFSQGKAKNMPIVYLYCKSGNSPIDKLATVLLSKYKIENRQIIIECEKLEKFLKQKDCI